jgi:UDP-N-acetylglucosamine--N-acetylmuramyl-(pentapeptide) pyrophosphoryl-undecaprenol N-acetylglucosamine transferase
MSGMKILLAGGGTAGHIEPALAVARAVQKKYTDVELLFLGTNHGLENELIPAAGFSLHQIPKVRIPRSITPALLKAPFQLVAAIRATFAALEGVDCAIGFGGYVSAPMYCACVIKRVPFVIHEQNAKAGWANRIGAYLTSLRALSYPISKGAISKGILTGLPLRSDVVRALEEVNQDWARARADAKRDLCESYGLPSDQPLVFIFGGSQGSQAINEVIESARPFFAGEKISILHGVGSKNSLPPSDGSYRAIAYISQMAQAYLAADLIIARSGAVTCAEVNALGRFALFIPLPVGNGEQGLNANSLVDEQRAILVNQATFSRQWLEANFDELLIAARKSPVQGDSSASAAADKIVELLERAMGSR